MWGCYSVYRLGGDGRIHSFVISRTTPIRESRWDIFMVSLFSRDQFCLLCIQVVTISLRCVSWLVKFPLPSLNRCVPTIGKLLFNLLKNYAKAGAKVGENFEMVLSAFKVNEILDLVLFISSLMFLTNYSQEKKNKNREMWLLRGIKVLQGHSLNERKQNISYNNVALVQAWKWTKSTPSTSNKVIDFNYSGVVISVAFNFIAIPRPWRWSYETLTNTRLLRSIYKCC